MSIDDALTKVQRNRVLAILKEAGFDAHDFVWEERSRRVGGAFAGRTMAIAALMYTRDRKYFFGFDFSDKFGLPASFLSPSRRGPGELKPATDFDVQLVHLKEWLGVLRENVEAPDLWVEAAKKMQVFSLTPGIDALEDTEFTEKERGSLKGRLDQVSARIEEIARHAAHESGRADYHGDEIKFLRRSVYDLKAAVDKLGRRSWTMMAVGTMTRIAWELGVKDQVIGPLWQFLTRGDGPGLLTGS